ncbi:MAG: patatin-like phospholipase family protein [Anaerolineae bacterium]
MPFKPLNENTGLAIDGGGIKGLIVALALQSLESQLGTRLIDSPSIKVLAGTSTGAIISAGICIGLSAKEIAAMYIRLGQTVFPQPPAWIPANLIHIYTLISGLFRASRFSSAAFKQVLLDVMGEITMGELNERLKGKVTLIITAVDINERRTHFIKSTDPQDRDWKLWQAVMASSAAPTVLPVVLRDHPTRGRRYYTDGGVGSYTNPALVATRELVEWRGYAPGTISVLSFGTGWVLESSFLKAHGAPDRWKILDWAQNAPMMIIGDGARSQSLEIITNYVQRGMDFRRFQVAMDEDIGLDDASDAALARLQELGEALGIRLQNNQHALSDLRFDPEGLITAVRNYEASIARTQAATKAIEGVSEKP